MMSNEQFPLGSSDPVRGTSLVGWLKRVVVLGVLVLLVSGAAYAMGKFIKWRAKAKIESEIAALVADLGRTNTNKLPSNSASQFAIEATVNRKLPDGNFTDLSGRSGSLSEYRGSVLVVSITSADCPISKKLTPALVRLAEEFGNGRVRFLLVNPEKDAKPAVMENHARLLPGWRYVPDVEARLARTLSARTTTETFVIDEAQTLRYRGSVDDRFDIGVSRQTAGFNYLRDAIAAVLEHQSVGVQLTVAPGCLLGLSPVDGPPAPVTWHNQISRFAQYNCVECHRPGAAGPFSLETYERVIAKKTMIKHVLEEGIMPPWFADHAYGKWRNTRAVSDADRKMFSEWVSAGCPEGDATDAPVPVKWVSGWSIRQPDIVMEIEPRQIPAEGYLPWDKFPVTFNVTQDLWVAEAEIHPSAPEVVHHAMLYVEYPKDDPRREAQTRAESEESGGANGFWLSYFPGRKALILPPGRGKLIPRNGKIFLQMHYVPNGTATIDKTRIGLKLLPAPPEKAVVTSSVIKWDFRIPPNSTAEYTQSEVLDEDIRLLCLMPHMHYRGAGAQVFLKHPDGRWETLLNVPKFDPEWQFAYEFSEPMLITKGSRIAIRHEYDNTAKNRRNPDPTIEVRHGNRTSDDMMINFFDWEPVGDAPTLSSKTKRRPFR